MGDWARFSLSMRAMRSDIAGPSSDLDVWVRRGLSGMGPSQSSVRMLSSERRRRPVAATSMGDGLTGEWWSRSSWKMGMVASEGAAGLGMSHSDAVDLGEVRHE